MDIRLFQNVDCATVSAFICTGKTVKPLKKTSLKRECLYILRRQQLCIPAMCSDSIPSVLRCKLNWQGLRHMTYTRRSTRRCARNKLRSRSTVRKTSTRKQKNKSPGKI